MKLKSIFMTTMLLAALGVFNSCSDENEKKKSAKLEFVVGDETISLEGANFYLAAEFQENNRTLRTYVISDGEYTNDGWGLGDLADATYNVSFNLSMGGEADFDPGNFNALVVFQDYPTENAASFFFEKGNEDDFSYFSFQSSNGELGEIITISGGLEGNNEMTIEFDFNNTILDHLHFDGGWIHTAATGKFYFKGTVDDQRPD